MEEKLMISFLRKDVSKIKKELKDNPERYNEI